MTRRALLAAVAGGALLVAAPRAVAGEPGAFYTPPRALPAHHGAVIRVKTLHNAAALPGAVNKLVLYRSTTGGGQAVAVSGIVSVPRGAAPKGGWPVVSYAHGTTGIADRCAPSVTPEARPPSRYPQVLLRPWIEAGYAVLRTDYQGLGTPGTHEYLVGRSEGRAVLDIVRAARAMHLGLSRRVAFAGHSEGGHAALWAAALAPSWTPELRVAGTVAFAPASHIGEQAAAVGVLTQPSALSSVASLILRGLDAARPDLGVGAVLSDRATELYPQTLTRCLDALYGVDSFGGLAPAGLFRPGADLAPLEAVLSANDPEQLRMRTSVRIEQGTADTIVLPPFTDALVAEYRHAGVPVTYRTYAGRDHTTVVAAAAGDANTWLGARLRGR